jgi:general secretion pathway protein F
LVAGHERDAVAQLHARGLRLLALKSKHDRNASAAIAAPAADIRRVPSSAEVNLAMEEMAVLLEAGVPLADAVANLARGRSTAALGPVLERMLQNLRGGRTLSACFESEQRNLSIPAHSLHLIRAGEETGQLAQAIRAVADQLASDEEFGKEVTNALTYPAVLVCSGIAATALVFVFVVPKFASVLNNPKADLPVLSQWILQAGLWLGQHRLESVIALIVFVAVGLAALRQPGVRSELRQAFSVIPGIGAVLVQIDVARWASMLSVLLKNKVPMVDALRHAQGALSLREKAASAQRVLVDVRTGTSLSEACGKHQLLDPIGQNLIRVGEQSGKLSDTVTTLAALERRAVQQKMRRLLILLEPITILAISVVLGGVMISIMLAITSLSNLL